MAVAQQTVVQLADRRVDLVRQQVMFIDGATTSLTTRETQLLGYLANRPEIDVSRDELLAEVWEYRANYATRAVDVAMRRLRAKVEPEPRNPVHLIAVHGVGYRFVPPREYAPAPSPDATINEEGPRSNLPPERSTFVGRDGSRQGIGDAFGSGARLVSVLGPGGIGKTRLAVHYAHDHVDMYDGGAWIVDLTAADDTTSMLASVGSSLQVPLIDGDDDETIAVLTQAMAARGPMLLVVDNAEHVLSSVTAALGAWLAGAHELKVLVTSRERLRMVGEHTIELGPLDAEEARALFNDRAAAVGATIEDDPAMVDRIVERLDRLPLAIELAAPRARVLSLDQLYDRLSHRFRVLSGTTRDATGRQSTLRKAIDWSWELLDAHEQRALAQCSVFVGGFTLDTAEAVIGATADPDAPWTLDLVEALRDKCLLHIYEPPELPGEVRFGTYESIREYAFERLTAMGQQDAAEATHAAVMLERCEALAGGADRFGGLERYLHLSAELPNLRAIVRRRMPVEPGDAIRAVLAMKPVLVTHGPFQLYQQLLDDALQAARTLVEVDAGTDADGHANTLAQLLVDRSELHRVRGRMGDAREDLGHAIPMVGESGTEVEVEALTHLSLINGDQSRIDEAEAIAATALQICVDHKYRDQQGVLTGMLASYAMMRGEPKRAEKLYLDAVSIHQEVGNERRAALDNGNLGMLFGEFGRIEESERRIQTALHTHRQWNNPRRVATTLMSLAGLRGRQGRLVEAVAHTEDALKLFREVGYTRFVAFALLNLGSLRWALGHAEEAIPKLLEAVELHRSVGDRLSEGMAQAYLGALLATIGDRIGARAAIERTDELLQGIYSKQADGIRLMATGFLALADARHATPTEAARLRAEARAKADDGTASPILGIRFIADLLAKLLETETT